MIIVDTYEPIVLVELLQADKKPLPAGDISIECDTTQVLIERKTWDDAYGSWQSKRLEAQITKMLQSDCPVILLNEGNPNDSWVRGESEDVSSFLTEVNGQSSGPNRYRQLRKFLMRMNVEVLPVVFTDDIEETAAYVKSLHRRVESGDFGYLVRKVTVVKSSRSVHHNMLQLIPGISLERSKQLFTAAENWHDLITNWDHISLSIDEKTRWQNTAKKLKSFWTDEWLVRERESILRKE
jgi:ERCC4-type nuclease